MKCFVRSILSVSLAMATMGVNAATLDSIDYFGYFRAGVAKGHEGSMKDSFGSSGFNKNKVGRLGNEFDVYGEFGFGTNVYKDDTKSVYLQTLISYDDTDTNSTRNDSHTSWDSLNLQFRNHFGMGEAVWAGIRNYKKNDFSIDIIDYFYWNRVNTGAGIENMSVGQGKLSVAALHKDFKQTYNDANASGEITSVNTTIDSNQLEILYDKLPVWQGGTLAMGYKFLNADPTSEQQDESIGNHGYSDGHTVMVELKQSLMETGENRTVLQYYADGTAINGVKFNTGDVLDGEVKSGNGWAIRNFGSLPIATDWTLSHAINFATANDIEMWNGDEGDANALSAVARLAYQWNDITRTYVEGGYFEDEKTVNGNDYSRDGAKYTLAQALTIGRSNQAELRMYASYFDSDNSDWDNTNSTFENGTSDDTWAVGVQANVWW